MIKLTLINEYSLLYEIQGKNDNGRLPYMLAAHLDVRASAISLVFKQQI